MGKLLFSPAVGHALLILVCLLLAMLFFSFMPADGVALLTVFIMSPLLDDERCSASVSSLPTSLSPAFHSNSVLRVPSSLCRRFWSTLALLAVVVCLFSVCDALLFVTRRFLKAACFLQHHFVVVYSSEVRVWHLQHRYSALRHFVIVGSR